MVEECGGRARGKIDNKEGNAVGGCKGGINKLFNYRPIIFKETNKID